MAIQNSTDEKVGIEVIPPSAPPSDEGGGTGTSSLEYTALGAAVVIVVLTVVGSEVLSYTVAAISLVMGLTLIWRSRTRTAASVAPGERLAAGKQYFLILPPSSPQQAPVKSGIPESFSGGETVKFYRFDEPDEIPGELIATVSFSSPPSPSTYSVTYNNGFGSLSPAPGAFVAGDPLTLDLSEPTSGQYSVAVTV